MKPQYRTVRRPVVVQAAQPPKSDGFGIVVFLTILFFPLGVVATLVYLLSGRIVYALLTGALTGAVAMLSFALYRRLTGG